MSHISKIAIIGATGAVGQELLQLIHSRKLPFGTLRCFASARSAGRTLEVEGLSPITVEDLAGIQWEEHDLAFFCASGEISRELAPVAAKAGCVVIDNSSAFRQDPKVPLIVPEINAQALAGHQGIIANPNCSTAIALMGLYPLHQAFGVKRFVASTYQAVSGSGVEAIVELEDQLKAWAKGERSDPQVYPYPIAFNVIPQVDVFLDDGYTKEEMKMVHETRKILNLPELRVSATCVRIPVIRAHSIAIFAEFEKPVNLEEARQAIEAFPGADLCDEPELKRYPMPCHYSEKVACGVGRLRIDRALDNGLAFWVVGDQLWKGAALNALQIAETL